MFEKNTDDNNKEIVDLDYLEAETSSPADSETQPTEKQDEIPSTHVLEEIKELQKQLEEKDELVNRTHDKYVRALADYENLQKRTKAEHTRIIKQANERLLLKLLDIVENFQKVEVSFAKEPIDIVEAREGFQAINRLLNSILKNEGIEKINALGEKFDPNFHEVIMTRHDDKAEPDTILEEVQPGFTLNSLLLRPSKVIIAKKDIE